MPEDPARLGRGPGLSPARRVAGLLLAAASLPALTAVLTGLRSTMSLESVLLLFLLDVVVIAAVGGVVVALLAAVAADLLVTWYFVPPIHTLRIEERDNLIALLVFLVVAGTVSVGVEIAARHRAAAARSQVEAETLARFAAEPVDEADPAAVLSHLRRTFGLDTVALVRTDREGERLLARSGPAATGAPVLEVDAGAAGMRVRAWGRALFAEDRRLLGRLATAAARAAEGRDLAATAERLAEVDRLRAALLAAVGHDLRTPLAGIKAAVGGLRDEDVALDDAERAELLATIDESADRLDALLANLLDLSRLQAGALSVRLEPLDLEEVLARALIGTGEAARLELPEDLPRVCADGGLLERVVANLVTNAVRHSPVGTPVTVRARATGEHVEVEVIDHGPGVPPERWPEMFVPFQRLDDRSPEGVGLGLAVARGFTEAMGGSITPARTHGGGLTMTVVLPREGRP